MSEIMNEYLKNKGWVIQNDTAYLKKDCNFKIPYSIEGTYKLYIEGIYEKNVRGDN